MVDLLRTDKRMDRQMTAMPIARLLLKLVA